MKKIISPRAIFAIRAGIAVVLVLFALVIFQVLVTVGPQVPTVDPDEARQRVNVFVVQPVVVHRQWKGYGTVEAIDSANVPARVTATVVQIPDKTLEGASVSKGQVLVKLDDTDFANQVTIAQKNLDAVGAQLQELTVNERSLTDRLEVETRDVKLARDELARVRKMFEGNAANQKDLDAAERTLLGAERSRLMVSESLSALGPKRDQLLAQQAGLASSLKIAQENLDRCTVISPIDGVIQFVDVEVGESLSPGQRVARVVNLDRVEAPLGLPAKARSYVRVGDRVRLQSTADTEQGWDGKVVRIAPEDDPVTRTFAAYVEVTQQGRAGDTAPLLVPGVFVGGTVADADDEKYLVVPRRSIRTERVMLVNDGVIQSSKVDEAFAYEGPIHELGLPDEQWAVLEGGVEPGVLVVLNPTRSLSDGQRVQPVYTKDPTASAAAVDQSEASRGNGSGEPK